MAHDVSVLFKGLAVITLLEVVVATDLLEPQALIVVDVLIVATVFEEDCNRVLASLDLARFDLVAGGNRVQSAVSLIQDTSLFEKACSLGSIASNLHDLTLECVVIDQSWGVLDS